MKTRDMYEEEFRRELKTACWKKSIRVYFYGGGGRDLLAIFVRKDQKCLGLNITSSFPVDDDLVEYIMGCELKDQAPWHSTMGALFARLTIVYSGATMQGQIQEARRELL